MEHPELKLEQQLCFPLYACSREVIKRYRPYLDAIGLTYTQYVVMMVLWEQGTLSVKALGQKLYLDSGTLTPVLKSLEQKGCLTRQRSPEDERLLMVTLTEQGTELRAQAADIPGKLCGCVHLTPEEAQTLRLLLNKLLHGLET